MKFRYNGTEYEVSKKKTFSAGGSYWSYRVKYNGCVLGMAHANLATTNNDLIALSVKLIDNYEKQTPIFSKEVPENLTDKVKELLTEHQAEDILSAMAKRTDITEEMIQRLQIYEGYNIVKVQGLNQQMQFEESMNRLFISQNDLQQNLFAAHF